MSKDQLILSVRRVVATEMIVCVALNRICHPTKIKSFFVLVSWLGDGKVWYALMCLLPLLYGERGLATTAHMVKVAVINLALYKLIKIVAGRSRPCVVDSNISLGTPPLDQYSFPSGHTMHAVAFATIAVTYHPHLAWLLMPLSSMIALSRIALGLHYPTDVIAGALVGGLTATMFPG